MATKNRYWLYLEKLRRSGKVNMYGAVPYLQEEFGLCKKEAMVVLNEWMASYNAKDYD